MNPGPVKKLKVIVVDDEQSIRDSIKWHLEDSGHEVITFSEPADCHVYQGHECSQGEACGHALITDYRMPKMNGLEFVAELVKNGCKGMTSNMMIMSGDTTDIDMSRAKLLGCRVVQKPLSLTELDLWLEGVALLSPCH